MKTKQRLKNIGGASNNVSSTYKSRFINKIKTILKMAGMELLQSIDEMSENERMYFKFIKIDLTDRSKKCNHQKALSLLKDLYERLEPFYEDWDNIYDRIERFVWHYDEKYTKVGIEEAARSVWPHSFILSPGTVDQPDGRITYDVGFEVF